MTPKRVFETMTDAQMGEMSLSLIAGTITRDDYCRLACWMDEGIRMSDYPDGDPTVSLLTGLSGAVTHMQRELLKQAMKKWVGIIQTYILDQENNAHLVAANPVQLSLDFTGERRARAIFGQVMGYGNTPVKQTKTTKRVKVTASVHRYLESISGNCRTVYEKRVAVQIALRSVVSYRYTYLNKLPMGIGLRSSSRHHRHVLYNRSIVRWSHLAGTGGL